MNEVVAIVLAAGKGTRMRSQRAKVLHPLLGLPMLDYPLSACAELGVGRSVVVVGHGADEVRERYQASSVEFALQSEQRGTGHAVASAREALAGVSATALILCGDVPLLRPETLEKLVAVHREAGNSVTVLSMEMEDPHGYGRLERDEQGRLTGIAEERDASEAQRAICEVNSGTYAVELPWLWTALDQVGADNAQGEYYLTDVVALAAGDNSGAGSLILEDATEAMGINSRVQLAEANELMRARISHHWMEAGVSLEDPASSWIGPGVALGEDVTIGPNCRLEGYTSVGPNVRIDQGCVITDATLGEGVHVRPYCVIHDAELARAVTVGPFAHLRPGTRLDEGAKAGNFVEIKNTVVGPGSKASHLTYLGDTEVGTGANIGAGTITCNYDGVNKHRTRIGDRAFIGSNTSLVAPVTVGDDATVGAGSVITQEVPEGNLAVSRAKQRNLSRWNSPRVKGKDD